jgi:hypothetical protein
MPPWWLRQCQSALAVPLCVATWLIAEMPHGDVAGFCLAVPLMNCVSPVASRWFLVHSGVVGWLVWWIEQLLHHDSISLVFHFLYICHGSSSTHLSIDESVGTKMASDFLKAGTSVRCLCKLGFTSSDRSPRFTKDWADSYLDIIVCNASRNVIESDTSVFEKQLLIIQMCQKYVYICADIFRKCSSQTSHRRSSDTIAVYEISEMRMVIV